MKRFQILGVTTWRSALFRRIYLNAEESTYIPFIISVANHYYNVILGRINYSKVLNRNALQFIEYANNGRHLWKSAS